MKRDKGLYLPPEPAWTEFRERPPLSRIAVQYHCPGTTYENSRYFVIRYEYPAQPRVCLHCEGSGRAQERTCDACQGVGKQECPPLRHLSIRRIDGKPLRSWRDLQRIKNAFWGVEAMAWEAFPPESELVDTSNQYHLWSIDGLRLPSAYQERLVANCPLPGGTQEPWEPGAEPPDVIRDAEQILGRARRGSPLLQEMNGSEVARRGRR